MKTREQIISEINPLLAQEFELDEAVILPEATIFDTLQLDSISLIDLVSLVKIHFDITIPKEEIQSIKTFGDLYNFVEQHQQ